MTRNAAVLVQVVIVVPLRLLLFFLPQTIKTLPTPEQLPFRRVQLLVELLELLLNLLDLLLLLVLVLSASLLRLRLLNWHVGRCVREQLSVELLPQDALFDPRGERGAVHMKLLRNQTLADTTSEHDDRRVEQRWFDRSRLAHDSVTSIFIAACCGLGRDRTAQGVRGLHA